MTKLLKVLMGVVLVGGTLAILDIWFDIFTAEIFGKVMLTLLIVGGMVGAVMAIRGDLDDEQRKRDKGFFN